MDQPMQQTNAPSPEAEQTTDMQPEQNEVSIEIKIQQDGSLSVCLEVGEEDQQEVPAASIDEACALAKKIYAQVMSQSSGDQQKEDAAYQQEMAAPTR